jgi:hypothetical protein
MVRWKLLLLWFAGALEANLLSAWSLDESQVLLCNSAGAASYRAV